MDNIQVPNIYYWEEEYNDKKTVMTAVFKYLGGNWGLSFSIEGNIIRRRMDRKKLIGRVVDTLDLLIHHGKKILDKDGNINPRLVNDEEAMRYYLDPQWNKRTIAFKKCVRVKNIDQMKAKELGLL